MNESSRKMNRSSASVLAGGRVRQLAGVLD